MAQFEHEYTGADFTAHMKAYNPSFLEGGLTGIFIGSYLQSITPKLALGLEAVWQRGGLTQGPDVGVSYVARYKSNDWIATAHLQSQGAFNTSYWRRLGEKVQAGVDMTLSLSPGAGGMMGGGLQKDGVCTFGAKYDFTLSTFRAQVDSKGKLSVLLEKRVGGPVMATFGAEVDHFTVSTSVRDDMLVPSPLTDCLSNSNKQRSAWASPSRPAARSSKSSKWPLEPSPSP